MFGYYLDLALRSLRRNAVLTALMVLAIAVGIGASMTTLTVMQLLSGDPLPGQSTRLYYPQLDPETGADVRREPPPLLDYISAQDLWRSGKADRQTMIIDGGIKVQPQAGQSPFIANTVGTTSDFFPMFRVPFRYGSAWSAADEAGAARQVVISEALNQRLFGGADSVGRRIVLNGSSVQVVGVLDHWRPRPRFYLLAGARHSGGNTSYFFGPPHDVYLPIRTALDINAGNFGWYTCWAKPEPKNLPQAPCESVALWVELDTPARVADYRRYLQGYDAQQRAMGRLTHPANVAMMSLPEWLAYQNVVPGDVKLQTWLAFGFLLVCLLNTVGLLLAKFLRRGGEIGVRRALGATRGSIFLQCLTESGVIGMLGGILGLALTLLGLWLVRQQPVEYADIVALNVPMFLLTVALAIVAALLAGVVPAMRASRIPPALQLKTL
ncbi:ABC transporter permease [Dyella sp.]|jgi:putative ABC transport system permease protein|uniref:ABC transporter permease n=1 Tax=Dyella sp. TaxID=1869338 RepID=UPI002D78971F|nr:ABC transporter permease [Dyella sp.]HET6431742.1 ABC transporter permease [Dyella sp.]